MTRAFSKVGIGWQVGVPSGWGTYGTNLALGLCKLGITPVLFKAAATINVADPADAALLQGALNEQPTWRDRLASANTIFDFPVLIPLADRVAYTNPLNGAKGVPNVGVPFFETAALPKQNVDHARAIFDGLLAGSTWNADVMRAHGLANVKVCLQGVDLATFHPRPRIGYFKDRFVVFSGGKLETRSGRPEFRKGQDLVIAAFKRFNAKHPDSVLITAWHSPWVPNPARLLPSRYGISPPLLTADGGLDVAGWLTANGIPPHAHCDVGMVANIGMPPIYAEADLAVFPNRCEGGTNLVAMECMACGIPVVLSRNTGHLDLIAANTCYTLETQTPLNCGIDFAGWCESSPDELFEKMAAAYSDRTIARKKGEAAAGFMQGWGWPAQIQKLVQALRDFA